MTPRVTVAEFRAVLLRSIAIGLGIPGAIVRDGAMDKESEQRVGMWLAVPKGTRVAIVEGIYAGRRGTLVDCARFWCQVHPDDGEVVGGLNNRGNMVVGRDEIKVINKGKTDEQSD